MPIKINKNNQDELRGLLSRNGWLEADEQIVQLEYPGHGNMNYTLRVETDSRSFIIKQSHDHVQRFPQMAAPRDRVLREAEFYTTVADHKMLAKYMPALLGIDRDNNLICLEDIAPAKDFTHLYRNESKLGQEALHEIIGFISALHKNCTLDSANGNIDNMPMRRLLAEHMFEVPLQKDNGIDLNGITPGLQKVARQFQDDENLRHVSSNLKNVYLTDGNSLLHGEYFPGNWLQGNGNGNFYIIDPEFCYYGRPEFEVGILLAHLRMANLQDGIVDEALAIYQPEAGFDETLMSQFMGMEIIRRLLGVSQLPLEVDLAQKEELLQEAASLVSD